MIWVAFYVCLAVLMLVVFAAAVLRVWRTLQALTREIASSSARMSEVTDTLNERQAARAPRRP